MPGQSRDQINSSITSEAASSYRFVRRGVPLIVAACVLVILARSQNGSPSHVTVESAEQLIPARLAALGNSVPRVVLCRESPFRIAPHSQYRDVVTDDDLAVVLCGAVPIWNPSTVSTLIHELKLWGPDAPFTREMIGRDRPRRFVLETLLSDAACRKNTSPFGGSYLLDSPYGIRVVETGSADASANRGEAHLGQLLKALAEGGASSSLDVTTASGNRGTVADVFQDAVLRFSFAQEPEFIGCSLVYWLPSGQRTWKNEFGNEFSFDQLLSEAISTPLGKGTCGGCHMPYLVVAILRLDEESDVLSAETRGEGLLYLKRLARLLEIAQLSTGGWDRRWAKQVGFIWGDDALDRIAITGHHLEWIALAPPDTIPSRETMLRAVAALRRDVSALTKIPGRPYKTLLPVSHAGRALALLRGADAFDVFEEAWHGGRVKVVHINGGHSQ